MKVTKQGMQNLKELVMSRPAHAMVLVLVFLLGLTFLDETVLAVALRIVVIVVCSAAMVIMLIGFARFRKSWNEKTRDYWFGRMMWCLTGVIGCSESLIRHTSFRYSTIFIVAAGLVTLKGTMTKGSWGTPPEVADKLRKDKRPFG